jgi:glycosyltransferase involved in cell wall biosynthesis
MSQPELSIVIPFLNEEQVLPLLRERLEKIRTRPAAWELLFVSDGSTDGSTKSIEAWVIHLELQYYRSPTYQGRLRRLR